MTINCHKIVSFNNSYIRSLYSCFFMCFSCLICCFSVFFSNFFITFNIHVLCLCIIISYLLTTHYSDIHKCISGMHVCCLYCVVLYCTVLYSIVLLNSFMCSFAVVYTLVTYRKDAALLVMSRRFVLKHKSVCFPLDEWRLSKSM